MRMCVAKFVKLRMLDHNLRYCTVFVAHLWITPEAARWELISPAVIMDYVLHNGVCVYYVFPC